jgi:prevent-host-death family protein
MPMATKSRTRAEEARNRLPELLTAAERGRSTVITRHGRPVAVLMPIAAASAPAGARPLSLLPLAGSGRGLWGRSSARTLRRLRGEWAR